MLELPRSARLAVWGSAVLAGTAAPPAATRAVTRADEPHRVVGLALLPVPGTVPGPTSGLRPTGPTGDPDGEGTDGPPGLVALLSALALAGVEALRVVLPVPGDVSGLPGPATFNQAALDAGECVLVEPDRLGLALLPEVTVFGSALDRGTLVTWHVHRVAEHRVTGLGGVAEAEALLSTSLRDATSELAGLEVAAWGQDAADRVADVRRGVLRSGALPPSTPPRCVRVLEGALRIRAIVALAREDDGGSVTAGEAARRAEALRALDSVARRAVVAAVNAGGGAGR
ncbi:MAG: hypothetical protein GXX79_04740 [Actinomycetales bacterium]|nr:hypothetical protein [Actinomycetales bacterium]